MMKKYLLADCRNGTYLSDDFETWTRDAQKAHVFVPGAALNACVERWRRHGVRVVEAAS